MVEGTPEREQRAAAGEAVASSRGAAGIGGRAAGVCASLGIRPGASGTDPAALVPETEAVGGSDSQALASGRRGVLVSRNLVIGQCVTVWDMGDR